MWKLTASWALQTLRVVGLFFLILPVWLGGAQLAPAADVSGRLSPGDQITVTVFGQADLSGTFQIDGDGYIELPLVGGVMVKQLTPKEGERAIEAKLADGYMNRPVVSVSVGEVRPVYVLGDVKTPGAYPFRYGISVLSAIAQAGGYGGPGRHTLRFPACR